MTEKKIDYPTENVYPFIKTVDDDLPLIHRDHIIGLRCKPNGTLSAYTTSARTTTNVVYLKHFESQQKCRDQSVAFILNHWSKCTRKQP